MQKNYFHNEKKIGVNLDLKFKHARLWIQRNYSPTKNQI